MGTRPMTKTILASSLKFRIRVILYIRNPSKIIKNLIELSANPETSLDLEDKLQLLWRVRAIIGLRGCMCVCVYIYNININYYEYWCYYYYYCCCYYYY